MDAFNWATNNIINCTKSVGYIADSVLNISKLAIPLVTGYDNTTVTNIQDPMLKEEVMNAIKYATKRSFVISPSSRMFIRVAGLSGFLSIALSAYGSHGYL